MSSYKHIYFQILHQILQVSFFLLCVPCSTHAHTHKPDPPIRQLSPSPQLALPCFHTHTGSGAQEGGRRFWQVRKEKQQVCPLLVLECSNRSVRENPILSSFLD